MPAQVPHTGRPSETQRLRRGKTPHRSPISAMAVLSPPVQNAKAIHGARSTSGAEVVWFAEVGDRRCRSLFPSQEFSRRIDQHRKGPPHETPSMRLLQSSPGVSDDMKFQRQNRATLETRDKDDWALNICSWRGGRVQVANIGVPGSTIPSSPSNCSGSLISRTSAPSLLKSAECSANAPCKAWVC